MDAEVGTRAVSEDNATVIVELVDKMRINDNSSPHQWVGLAYRDSSLWFLLKFDIGNNSNIENISSVR